MALTTKQAEWIVNYTRLDIELAVEKPKEDENGKGKDEKPDPLAAVREEFRRKREDELVRDQTDKDTLLDKANSAVFAYKDVLRAAFDFQMGSAKKMESMRDDKHGDQESEVGSDDIRKRGQKGEKISTYDNDGKENIALLSKATNAFDIVVKEKKRLTAAMTTRSKLIEKDARIEQELVPLFTNDEVTDLFFTPLVRARLIPDGVIIDDFSATQRMLNATNKIYIDEELKGASDPKSNVDEIGGTIAGIGGSIATAITSSLGVDSSMSKGLIEAGVALVSLGVSATTLALGVEDKDVKDLCAKVPDIVGTVVGAVTGNDGIATAIKTGGKAAVNIGAAGVAKLKGKTVTAQDIGNLIKECVVDALSSAAGILAKDQKAAEVCTLLIDMISPIDIGKAAGIAAGLQKGDWKAVSSGVFSMLADFASKAPTLASDGMKVSGEAASAQLTTALKDAGPIVSEGLSLVSTVLTAKDANEVADKLAAGLPDILGKIVSAATASETKIDIGSIVSSGASAAATAATMIKDKAQGKDVDPGKIQSLLQQCIDTALTGAAQAVPKGSTAATEIGVAQKALDGIVSAEEVKALLSATNADEAKKAASKLMLKILLAAPGAAGSSATGSGTETGKDVGQKLATASGILDKIQSAGDDAKKRLEEAKKEVDAIQKELAESHDQDAEKEADDLMDEIEKERAEYQEMVKKALQPDGQQKLIMKMISDMKRDQAIMNMAISLGSAGVEVAAQFFAPLAIGKEILKMVAHLGAVIQRARDLKKFLDAQEWAESAVTPYRSSIDNFLKNQQEQLTEHSIKAAMCALRIASEAAAVGFPAAKAVSVGVTIAQSAVDVGFSIYKEAEMRTAWMTTKEALADPTDRKLGHKARRLNPTLSKYSIAYGALTAKDPVAVKTMNEVGLTNDMLQSEEAGVKLVKVFLETRFPEDGKVAFKWDTTAEWAKKLPAPALETPNIFTAFKGIGEEAAKFYDAAPGVLTAPPNAMVGSLGKFQSTIKQHDALMKATEKVREAAKKESATPAEKTAFRDALTKEIEAGKEARRLATTFKAETTKLVGAITGQKAQKGDPKAFTAFIAAAADIVVTYRALADDQIEQLESDLLTPLIELTKVEASLKAEADPMRKAA
jgi:hypothetical protein